MIGRILHDYSKLINFKPREQFDWWRLVKQPRALRDLFLRAFPLAVGRFTPYWVTSVWTVTLSLYSIARKQGAVGLVRYLKVLYIITQQAAGGQRLQDLTSLGVRVARTAKGVPRIIPREHRKEILAGKASTIRLYLTLFGLYRVIDIPGRVNIKSIIGLCLLKQSDHDALVRYLPNFWRELGKLVGGREVLPGSPLSVMREAVGYRSEEDAMPTLRATRILPIVDSGPLSQRCGDSFIGSVDPLWLKYDAKAEARKASSLEEGKELGFLLGLWRGLRPAEVPIFESLSKRYSDATVSNVGSLFFTISHWMNSGLLPMLIAWVRLYDVRVVKDLFKAAHTERFAQIVPWGPKGFLSGLGKLAFLDEAAGKVRVVAMVDAITQSLFYPLHNWVFTLLRNIPQDGTFNQDAPIKLLVEKGYKELYSYDLSSATDRLPLALQESLLGYIIGEEAARLWATLLVGREYSFHPRTAKKRNLGVTSVKYACGQPMGAYSSWAMLALTHHFIVQVAAWSINSNKLTWFQEYAVLGDDVVIADQLVAREYFRIMTQVLHVQIQETKSLISENGTFEFAKRTYVRGKDATPISLKGFLVGQRNLACLEGFLAKLPVLWGNRVSDIARSLGFGYKSLSRLQSALWTKSRLSTLLIFLTRPQGVLGSSFFDWITRNSVFENRAAVQENNTWSILQSLVEYVESKLLIQIRLREKAFKARGADRRFVPSLSIPTRTLFDVFSKAVLRPIGVDLESLIAEIETWLLEVKSRLSCQVDKESGTPIVLTVGELEELYGQLARIVEEINLLPKTPKVILRRDLAKRLPKGIEAVKLWRRIRKVVRWA